MKFVCEHRVLRWTWKTIAYTTVSMECDRRWCISHGARLNGQSDRIFSFWINLCTQDVTFCELFSWRRGRHAGKCNALNLNCNPELVVDRLIFSLFSKPSWCAQYSGLIVMSFHNIQDCLQSPNYHHKSFNNVNI